MSFISKGNGMMFINLNAQFQLPHQEFVHENFQVFFGGMYPFGVAWFGWPQSPRFSLGILQLQQPWLIQRVADFLDTNTEASYGESMGDKSKRTLLLIQTSHRLRIQVDWKRSVFSTTSM